MSAMEPHPNSMLQRRTHTRSFFLQEKIVTSVNTDGKQKEQGYLGKQVFELSNHLGNILATITDKKLQVSTNTTSTDYFEADVQTVQDYYAFGMQMPGRKLSGGYRYGFNGKELDTFMDGNNYDYGFRIYNPQVGRFLSIDPLLNEYQHFTPYQFSSNSPIFSIDRDGREFEPYWATTVPNKIRAFENDLRKKDPQHAENIIFQKNVNAFLFVGGALTAGFSFELYGLRTILTNSFKLGLIGSATSSTIAWANGGDKYEIVRSATSGFFSGAVLGVAGPANSISKLFAVGAASGVVGEIVNQEFDNKFGKGNGYELQKIVISGGIAALANIFASSVVDRISLAIEKQLATDLLEIESTTYRKTLRKAILERTPRIGTQQLKQAVNQEIKSAQQLLRKQASGVKAAIKQGIERSVDYIQDRVNEYAKKDENNP